MDTFNDRTSMDRILFSVFSYENLKEGTKIENDEVEIFIL